MFASLAFQIKNKKRKKEKEKGAHFNRLHVFGHFLFSLLSQISRFLVMPILSSKVFVWFPKGIYSFIDQDREGSRNISSRAAVYVQICRTGNVRQSIPV